VDHHVAVHRLDGPRHGYKNSNLIIGTKRCIDGLSLRATDTDWSHGCGPEVSGPILDLLIAMTGRKPAASQLTGEGVAALQARPQRLRRIASPKGPATAGIRSDSRADGPARGHGGTTRP
jgi:hypothetical protein